MPVATTGTPAASASYTFNGPSSESGAAVGDQKDVERSEVRGKRRRIARAEEVHVGKASELAADSAILLRPDEHERPVGAPLGELREEWHVELVAGERAVEPDARALEAGDVGRSLVRAAGRGEAAHIAGIADEVAVLVPRLSLLEQVVVDHEDEVCSTRQAAVEVADVRPDRGLVVGHRRVVVDDVVDEAALVEGSDMRGVGRRVRPHARRLEAEPPRRSPRNREHQAVGELRGKTLQHATRQRKQRLHDPDPLRDSRRPERRATATKGARRSKAPPDQPRGRHIEHPRAGIDLREPQHDVLPVRPHDPVPRGVRDGDDVQRGARRLGEHQYAPGLTSVRRVLTTMFTSSPSDHPLT